jgi:hypothetical protein
MINIMFADLLIILANMPIAIYNAIHKRWMFGQNSK